MLVYLDGSYLPKEEAKVSVDDRGFLFGDGVYEVTRAIRGEIFEEGGHWKRLQAGLRGTGIGPDVVEQAQIREIYSQLLTKNGLGDTDAILYLQVTRGCAPRAHAFPSPRSEPTIYAFASPFSIPADLRRNGVDAITQADIRWSRCDLKTINLLPNVVAKQRAVEAGAWEAIFVRDGVIIEGAATNAFGVIGGELRTYPKSNYILPGITRDVVLELARGLGIPTREAPIFAEEVDSLEEFFVTGTTSDVQAIVRLDGRPIGNGVVGEITASLLQALLERMGASLSAAV